MSAAENGALSLIDRARREPEPSPLEQAIHAIPTESIGMAIQHHRDEILRLQKTRRSTGGVGSDIPVGNEALIKWHGFLLGALRTEARERDWGTRG